MTFETSVIRDVCTAEDIRLKYLEQRDVEIVKYIKKNTSIIPVIDNSVNILEGLVDKINSSLFDTDSSTSIINIINNNISTINSSISTINSSIDTINSSISTINSSIDTINSSINDIKSSYVKSITITEQTDTNITKEDKSGNIILNPNSYIFNIYNISTNKGDTEEKNTVIGVNYKFVELYLDTSTVVDNHDSSIKDIQSKLPLFVDLDEGENNTTTNP